MSYFQISTTAKVNLKLSLVQVVRNPIYSEADPQYIEQAYFKTSIHLRNAFQGEPGAPTESSLLEKDVINITLSRPLVFVQPVAVDRAILFWLSYKNAYEYWTEQRLSLNKEVQLATEQVLEKVPISQITSQLSSQHVGTLFLQLNVQDIGVCLPLSTPDLVNQSILKQVLPTNYIPEEKYFFNEKNEYVLHELMIDDRRGKNTKRPYNVYC